ncbi:MBOAT family O-acyltransferase [Sorangium sp. So ce176]|uniref:MBOAT family O-acyltransferase n=1 Tax=Sorangium sp. So ce176 TaxID=3133286 RepID=UPI003F6164AD
MLHGIDGLGVATTAMAVLLLRALPAAAVALVSKGVSAGDRAVVLLLYAALAAWVGRLAPVHIERLAVLCAALGYWVLAAALVAALVRAGAWRRVPAPAALILVAAVWLAAPAALLTGPARAAVVLAGVDGMFSIYSLVRDGDPRTPLRDSLFFLLVDPTLVLSQRARRVAAPGLRRRDAARLALGVAAVAASVALALAAAPLLSGPRGLAVEAPLYARAMAIAGIMALSFYAGHSGVASIQIALLSMLGFRVGERYVFPLAATSPRDFWRRWNVHLGQWLRRYAYIPCVRSLGRRVPVPVADAIAVLAAFGLCGVLHAGVQLLIHGQMPWTVVAAFGVHGCALVAWDRAARAWRARPGRGTGSAASREASRLLFLQFSLVMLLWLYPALAGASASAR